MPARAYGPNFEGDTITWSNGTTPFKISFKKYANAAQGCDRNSPFENMPPSKAVSTAQGSQPTTGNSPDSYDYKVILKDAHGKPLDPHLRVCHLQPNITVRC